MSRPIQAVDRWRQILERVAADQTIHVPALARELGVSEMTIRRDIRRLERDGFVRQTYGGAAAHLTRSFDISFNARALQSAREKRLIGMRAAELVGDARVVYLGIGTTAEQFARYLPARDNLTIVTASLPIASLLGTRAIKIVCLGGVVLRDELSCIGPGALRTLGTYRFDLAVVGAAGFSARWGITELTDEEAEVQRSVLERAARVVVIADGSKIGAVTSALVGPADGVATLVTDPSAPDDELTRLRKLGVDIVVAKQSPRATADRPETPARAMAASRHGS
ncbi:MAG TPA: DeoR/GlpR family DNA-binding transcription regulator [Candidatus Limnocylindrales bacterium]|nr:DeoR/GlpR family DNA-binding transcription regulator [Candidatus Limnocylindrales bacterium]